MLSCFILQASRVFCVLPPNPSPRVLEREVHLSFINEPGFWWGDFILRGEGGSTLVISDVSNTANNGALCELGCNEFPSERITSA